MTEVPGIYFLMNFLLLYKAVRFPIFKMFTKKRAHISGMFYKGGG